MCVGTFKTNLASLVAVLLLAMVPLFASWAQTPDQTSSRDQTPGCILDDHTLFRVCEQVHDRLVYISGTRPSQFAKQFKEFREQFSNFSRDESFSQPGVLIDSSGFILTARGPISEGSSLEVHFPDRSTLQAAVIVEDSTLDLALVAPIPLPSNLTVPEPRQTLMLMDQTKVVVLSMEPVARYRMTADRIRMKGRQLETSELHPLGSAVFTATGDLVGITSSPSDSSAWGGILKLASIGWDSTVVPLSTAFPRMFSSIPPRTKRLLEVQSGARSAIEFVLEDYLFLVLASVQQNPKEFEFQKMLTIQKYGMSKAVFVSWVKAEGFEMALMPDGGIKLMFPSTCADPLRSLTDTRGDFPTVCFRDGSAWLEPGIHGPEVRVSDGTKAEGSFGVLSYKLGRWNPI